MDGLEIRSVREEEYDAVIKVMEAAFGGEHTEADREAWRPAFPFDRSLAAFEDGRMVAVTAVLSMDITVPGGQMLPMGGLSYVSTSPTHRRRGLLRRMVQDHFAGMTDRGECVSGLGASEGNIYGRFGYGPATSAVNFSVERAYSDFVPLDMPSNKGRLLVLDPEEARAKVPELYESHARPAGAVSRPSWFWHMFFSDPPSERAGATPMLHVIHENEAGKADGYVGYRTKDEGSGYKAGNTVRVAELIAADQSVYATLWRFLLDTDLCRKVTCSRGRVDEPLRWMLSDLRHFRVEELYDFLWLRILDVPRALKTRRYANPGSIVLEVGDPFPDPRGRSYRLTVDSESPDGTPAAGPQDADFPSLAAECAPTKSRPDLSMDVSALSAAYLGGVSFCTLTAAGRMRELTAGAAARADAIFSTPTAPFCSTEF